MARQTPMVKRGQRIDPNTAQAITAAVFDDGGPREVLIRHMKDWNTASTVKARTENSKAFAPYRDRLEFSCRRVGPSSVGLYVNGRDE